MKFLFLFAHPDDETVSCGATIKFLADAGHDVTVVSLTDGSSGEVMPEAEAALAKYGSLGALRRHEFQEACSFLGVSQAEILHFTDGEITNNQVWGKLTDACRETIDTYKPDVLITFDHSGWYFHLDHVGVSIATTLAAYQAEFPPAVFFHTLMQVQDSKWKYVFPSVLPITHQVNATTLKEFKIKALNLHASQSTATPQKWIQQRNPYYELYQLVFCQRNGQDLLKKLPLFSSVTTSVTASA